MDSTEQALAAGVVGGFVTMFMFFSFAMLVLLIIARWKLFQKAGVEGWKSLIPIYSDFVQWKIGWKNTNLFWVYFALYTVGYILYSMSGAVSATYATTQVIVNMPMLTIGGFLMLGAFVLGLMAAYKLFLSFGQGVGMFIAYIFFPSIVLMVLGFGSAQYQGAQD